MIDTSYLMKIKGGLRRGGQKEVAIGLMCSPARVSLALSGQRDDEDVVRATENRILTDGNITITDYMNIGIEIMKHRGAENPRQALVQEILKFII